MAPQTRSQNTEDEIFERLLVQLNMAMENRDQLSQQREQEREQRFLATMIEQIQANSSIPPHQPSSSVLGPGLQQPPRTPETQPETHAKRNLRLTFPRFSSGDPADWLFSIQQYFMYYATPLEDRLLLASMHLNTPVSCWFQSMAQAGRLTDWNTFVSGLHKQFGPS